MNGLKHEFIDYQTPSWINTDNYPGKCYSILQEDTYYRFLDMNSFGLYHPTNEMKTEKNELYKSDHSITHNSS
jgi:hypothetical protein